MKKITAIIIAVILILSPLQTMVFAAEPTDSVDSGETITESGTLQEPGDPGEAEDPGDMPETQVPAEPQVQGEAAAPSEPSETPSASVRPDEPLDPSMEDSDIQNLEKGATPDYMPLKLAPMPPLARSMRLSSYTDTIQVFKTAVPSKANNPYGECGVYDVELKITGQPPEISADIVLVIDTSGSMSSGNRMASAKNAAKEFVNTLLANPNDTSARIALVSFAENAQTVRGFTYASGKQGLINAINGLSATGGTHTQAGIRQARILLNPSTADSKNIVFLSDGEPTYSYAIKNISNNLNSTYFYKENTRWYTRDDLAESVYNYGDGARVGGGASMTTQISGSKYYYHHGNSAVAESRFAKNSGFTIYSVGLTPGSAGQDILNRVASPGKSYGATTEDLEDIFQDIARGIDHSATDAVVTDVIDENFELVAGSFISTPSAPVTYDETTQNITWTPGNISTLATLNYKVRAKTGVMGNDLPTNDSAVLSYTDINGNPNQKIFPDPKVNVLGVKARNDLTIVVGDPEISLGEDLQVYGYEPFQYLWTNDKDPTWSANSPNPAVQPEEDTVYTIQITDKYGCKKSDDVKVTVKKGKIKITKIVLEGVGGIDTAKEFVIHMDGPQGKMWNTFLKHQQISEISNLRPGEYQITEVVPMNYSLKSIENANVTLTREMILNDQVVVVTVTNEKVNDSWFEDEDDKDNFFTVSVSSTNNRLVAIVQSLKAVLPEREKGLEAEDKTSS